MAATFRPVNNPLPATEGGRDETPASSVTMRPTTAPEQPTRPLGEATTPTRASFGAGALASQKPLPNSPFPESAHLQPATMPIREREQSQQSRRSRDSDDMDMDDSGGEGHAGGDGAASEGESLNGDGRKSKKKKSQRFYCTDFPPCNLSFTRSEHLARHIRKHTGERPFQCHCQRRFSRLDNLRQHAQTVHVNEDIPIDSPAATGTRFQRQIRTDRVRQTGRARASTAGSVGGGVRGHSKSLSTSSIASVSSIASTYSVGESRRRPPPLVMADPRSRMSLEPYRGHDGQYYRPPSPGDFSTPTSATFSTGQNSPRWGPVMSPGSGHARSHSMYAAGSRTPGRRLSVPSGGNPFQSPHGAGVRGPVFGPPGVNSSNAGAFSPTQGSVLGSPTTSTATWSRRESVSSTADEAWRRRTWHPDTRDYNGTSRLSQVITPSQFPPDPVTLPPPNPAGQQQQAVRLPGIESFDAVLRGPPFHPTHSGEDTNMSGTQPPPRAPEPSRDDQPGHPSQWDANYHLQRGLTRLDIHTPPRDTAGEWANEANQALQARAEQARVRFDPEVETMPAGPGPMPPTTAPAFHGPRHQHTVSAPSFSTPRESRRHGWYNGPVTVHPPREASREGRSHVDRMAHPNISSFQGFPAREEQPAMQHQQGGPPPMERMERAERMERVERMERIPERPANQRDSPEDRKRLDALVAVATGQGSVATAY